MSTGGKPLAPGKSTVKTPTNQPKEEKKQEPKK